MGLYSGGLIIGRIFAAEIFGGLFFGGLIIGILRYFVLGYFEEREIGYDCSEARGVFLLYPVGVGYEKSNFGPHIPPKSPVMAVPLVWCINGTWGEGVRGMRGAGVRGGFSSPNPSFCFE